MAIRFKDYETTYNESVRKIQALPGWREITSQLGIDLKSYRSVYQAELRNLNPKTQSLAIARMLSELAWYEERRPYFNVFPAIERKFRELNESIDLRELTLPFTAIEIRTVTRTMLISMDKLAMMFIVDGLNGDYQEFTIAKQTTIQKQFDAGFVHVPDMWGNAASAPVLTFEQMHECVMVAVGTCLLAADRSIVTPIILNVHRKESMTPAEVADYAERAKQRTRRIGFDVGRDLERMKTTEHYRNGCFAKYYVGKDHDCYPKNAEQSLVPIIKWRSGAIVNKGVLPPVPTGFKDSDGL